MWLIVALPPAPGRARFKALAVAQVALPRTALVRRARRINRELARLYPDAHIELNFTSPLELLVAAILSARTTDRKVNEVTPVLFARYRTAADYAAADQAELEKADRANRVLPRQGEHSHSPGPGVVRSLRRQCSRHAGRARDLAGCWPQDCQCRTRRCLRQAKHHGGHTLRPAGAAVWLDGADRSGKDRARRRRAPAPAGVDGGFPSRDLARSPCLSRSQARVRCLRRCPVVPVVRRGSDR